MSLRKEILTLLREGGPIRRYYLYVKFKPIPKETIRGRLSELIKEGKIIKKSSLIYENDLFILQPPILQNIIDIET